MIHLITGALDFTVFTKLSFNGFDQIIISNS